MYVMSNNILDRVLVDYYGPLPVGWNGTSYIFVVLENFSRFVRLYPLKKATAAAAANRMVNDYIVKHGRPKQVVSDHRKQFSSRLWQTCLTELGITPTHTSVYHPPLNPSERAVLD